MSVIKGGPNPNAARVFYQLFLSRRGQIALQNITTSTAKIRLISRRIDIQKICSDGQPHVREKIL